MASTHFTIIRSGRVLDVDKGASEAADILIERDTIREIGRPGLAAPDGAESIDAGDRLLMPGLINAHTHAHGSLAKGLVGESWPLEVFLTSAGTLNGDRSLEDKYLSALLSAVEMARKGCTAGYDLFVEFPLPTADGLYAVAKAYSDVGLRATVAPMMADRTLYQAVPGLLEAIPASTRKTVEVIQAAPFEASIAACRDLLKRWPFDRDRVRPALGPTIPLHCSDDFLVACRDLAREFDVGLQTHLAESRVQAVTGLKKYGKTLTAHLNELGLIGPTFSAAHAVWVDRDDIARMADAGASVAHNVLSNLRLGSGLAPVRPMLDSGLRVGIGTDAANTSDSQNMFEALRMAAFVSKIQTPDYTRWLTALEVLQMATTGSAGVLGFGTTIGRLAPGYKADIVFIDLSEIGYVPLNDPLLQLVNAESGGGVDSVMIGGRMIVRGKRVLTVDEAALRRDVERAAARLNEASASNREAARRIGDYVGAFCVSQARCPYHVERLAKTWGVDGPTEPTRAQSLS